MLQTGEGDRDLRRDLSGLPEAGIELGREAGSQSSILAECAAAQSILCPCIRPAP